MSKAKAETESHLSVEERLKALYELQQIDSEIDKLRTVRGELPLEVQDLEDVVSGLDTRLQKFKDEVQEMEQAISDKKNAIKDSQALVKKYESQQNKVRNNREYDSLTKELEFQRLEMQLSEKRIKEFKASIEAKSEFLDSIAAELKEKKAVLKEKKSELDDIIAETEKEETSLLKKSKAAEKLIEERLLNAYHRIRQNSRNGLAVVEVQRDACGGCFNKIPPQRQLDISMNKKIIVCEHCGRILVDPAINPDYTPPVKEVVEEKPKKTARAKAKAKAKA